MTDRRRLTRPRGRRQKRERYHGFSLNDTERERTIALFIDDYDGDIAELIKSFLYEQATGHREEKDIDLGPILEMLNRIWTKVRDGVPVAQREEVEQSIRTLGALDRFNT